jgi:hypothetical protein
MRLVLLGSSTRKLLRRTAYALTAEAPNSLSTAIHMGAYSGSLDSTTTIKIPHWRSFRGRPHFTMENFPDEALWAHRHRIRPLCMLIDSCN